MKKMPLASPAVRGCCIILDAVLACLAALWLFLAFSWPALLAVTALFLLMALYSVQVFCSAILVDPVERTISFRGLRQRKDDVSGAARVRTRETALNGQTTRVIVVEDGDGRELSVISTLNNANKGYGCEAAARELAGTLGVEFCPTVPAHLYDKAARREQEAAHTVNYDEMDGEGD